MVLVLQLLVCFYSFNDVLNVMMFYFNDMLDLMVNTYWDCLQVVNLMDLVTVKMK